jgi:hypothetical protein
VKSEEYTHRIESARAFVAETLKLDCTLSDLVSQTVL